MADMNREQLVDWLLERNIQFARNESINVLPSLYNANIKAPDSALTNHEESGNVHEVEAALDAQIRILEKRAQIAQLQRELAESCPLSVQHARFEDVQHAVGEFSGSDSYDANKWLADFERACESGNGDDSFRLRSIRRLMKRDTPAEWFLRTDDSTTYTQFRWNFIQNFGHVYSMSEIIDKMTATTFS